jgi:hypothetical protein
LVAAAGFTDSLEFAATVLGKTDQLHNYEAHFVAVAQVMQKRGILPADMSDAELTDWANKHAARYFGWKAFYGFFGPGAPTYDWPSQAYEDEWHGLLEDNNNDFRAALDIWWERHPDLWMIPVARTENAQPDIDGTGLQPPRLPNTKLFQDIMEIPGVKERFADNPAALMLVLPPEAFEGFDFGAYYEAIGNAQLRHMDSIEFLSSAQSKAGAHYFFRLADQRLAWQDYYESQGITPDMQEYRDKMTEITDAQDQVLIDFPGFKEDMSLNGGSYEAGSWKMQGTPFTVLQWTRTIANDPELSKLPGVQGLGEYLTFRDEMANKLQELGISSITDQAAKDTGLTAQYDAKVAELSDQYGEGWNRFYQAYFDRDLHRNFPSGAEEFAANFKATDPTGYAAWETWQGDNKANNKAIAAAVNDAERARLYVQKAELDNQAYEQGFADAEWGTATFAERRNMVEDAKDKPYVFATRWERENIYHEVTSDAPEAKIVEIQRARADIAQAQFEDPTADVGWMYDRLNGWIREQTSVDAAFNAYVQHSNTFGWAFFTAYPDLITQEGPAGDAWRSIYQTLPQAQQLASAGMTDTYKVARRDFEVWVTDTLYDANPTFARQWDFYEQNYGYLTDQLMPSTYYPLGGN